MGQKREFARKAEIVRSLATINVINIQVSNKSGCNVLESDFIHLFCINVFQEHYERVNPFGELRLEKEINEVLRSHASRSSIVMQHYLRLQMIPG